MVQTPSRAGRWLRERRLRFSLWIAAVEAILVAFLHDISRYTVFALAIAAVALYLLAGRRTRSDVVHQGTWILAFSQLLAALAAILAVFVFWLAIVAMVVFIVVALFYVFADRR
jgi:hypothetical protein